MALMALWFCISLKRGDDSVPFPQVRQKWKAGRDWERQCFSSESFTVSLAECLSVSEESLECPCFTCKTTSGKVGSEPSCCPGRVELLGLQIPGGGEKDS